MKTKLLFLFALLWASTSLFSQDWNGNNTTTNRAAIGGNSNQGTKLSVYNNDSYYGIYNYNSSSNPKYGMYNYMYNSNSEVEKFALYTRSSGANTWALYARGRTGIQGDLERINPNIGNAWTTHLGWQAGDFSYSITPRDAAGSHVFSRKLQLHRDGRMVKYVDSSATEAFAIRKNGTNEFMIEGDGDVYARSLKIKLGAFPDYVFSESYDLMPLEELSSFIKAEKHLPNIPAEKEIVSNGLDVGNMQSLQMEKIEELTLYILDLNERIKKLEAENNALKVNNK